MLAFGAVQYAYAISQRVEPMPYSQFQLLLHDKKIAEIGVSDRYIQGKLKSPLPNGRSAFVTTRVDPQFADELQKYGVTYTGEVESKLLQDVLSWIVPVVLFFAIWTFLVRRMGQGMGGALMAIGKSKAKVYVESDTGVRFDDVAGVDEAKDELCEIVDFLEKSSTVWPSRRTHAQRCAPGWSSWYRQNVTREGSGGAGQSAILFHLRVPSSWRCSWALVQPGYAISLFRRAARRACDHLHR